MKKVLLTCLAVAMAYTIAYAAEEIKLGSINDLTGASSDVGLDAAVGVKACVTFINDTGGINGKKIHLLLRDYGYSVPEAITIYKAFKNVDKIAMLLQWGTGDTEALSSTVNRDKMVTISDSLSGHLCDPKKTPYNFIYSTDYSTNARAALTAWFEDVWMKAEKWKKVREAGQRPKLVCFYMFASPYSNAPIKAIKDQACLLGFEIGKDQDVSLLSLDAKSQVLTAKAEHPTVIWHGNNKRESVAAAIKAAYVLGLRADHIINVWAFDEDLAERCGKAGEGIIGTAACAFPHENVPCMDKVREYDKKVRAGARISARISVHTVQGWLKASMACAGLGIADKRGSLDGPSIKAAMESLKNWYPFDIKDSLGRPPTSLTATDHRPSPVSLVYTVRSGKITLLKKVDMKQKFPDRWQRWLGW